MPVLTDTPREMVFYGRVAGTLRKSFERLDADVSTISLWADEARAALVALNAAAPDPISSALLLLPEDPDGLTYLVDRLPSWTNAVVGVASDVGDALRGGGAAAAPRDVVVVAKGAAPSGTVLGAARATAGAAVGVAALGVCGEAIARGLVAGVGFALAALVSAWVAGLPVGRLGDAYRAAKRGWGVLAKARLDG